uniref:Putative maturase n=1 Tax=Mesotaenium endlicherianum TaxID=184485 RepID=A0A024B577_9VIRI|nr:putative maturase [Mesotaenium endlicherianum]AHZ11233.1 putative maturase [Mesotaenium endlicherianum]
MKVLSYYHQLYPLLLQEDLHSLTLEAWVGSSDPINSLTYNSWQPKWSFMLLKREIANIRAQSNKSHLSPIALNTLSCILVILWESDCKPDWFFSQFQHRGTYTAMHSALACLEGRTDSQQLMLRTHLPSCVHPEISVRLLRDHFSDLPLLHLFRQILHFNHVNFYSQRWTKLTTLLWNRWALEFDSFFDFKISQLIKPDFHSLQSANLSNCYRKLVYLTGCSKLSSSAHQANYGMLNVDPGLCFNIPEIALQYIRCGNAWSLSVDQISKTCAQLPNQGSRWLEQRLGYYHTSSLWSWTKAGQKCVFFLGFALQLQAKVLFWFAKETACWVQMLDIQERFYVQSPNWSLFYCLEKHSFASHKKGATSRFNWSLKRDEEILKRFKHLCKVLSLYYYASNSQQLLAQLVSSLRFSCAKTLAFKHKTNLRSIWKHYATALPRFWQPVLEDYLFFSSVSSINPKILSDSRIWFLEYAQVGLCCWFCLSLQRSAHVAFPIFEVFESFAYKYENKQRIHKNPYTGF